jgi:hypothetical protein
MSSHPACSPFSSKKNKKKITTEKMELPIIKKKK